MTINSSQRQESTIDKLLGLMQSAYISDNLAMMEELSKTILQLHYQNELFIMKNKKLELDHIKKENRQLIDLYSNILVLQFQMQKNR
ncbi:MAG: hypothetical protein ACW98X_10515 [Promethearchaeota archaeon]|jgi:hypothetical protein